MPRCGCTDTCTCLVTGGEGVDVEGIGTIERPYVVSSSTSDLTGRLVFNDSATVDFSTVGAGTLTSPTTISAEASLPLTDLSDVSPTPPTNGESPVWRTDHWEWEPSMGVGIPGGGVTGTVLTKQSAGDGDAVWQALPVSGIWGTAPLDAFGSDTLVGREIYLDVNGQLRGQPLTLTTAKPNADLIATYPNGLTAMPTVSTDGWPLPIGGTVLTVRQRGFPYGYQIWSRNNGSSVIDSFFRQASADGWSAWLPLVGDSKGRGTVSARASATTDVNGVFTWTHGLTAAQVGATSNFLASPAPPATGTIAAATANRLVIGASTVTFRVFRPDGTPFASASCTLDIIGSLGA